MKKKEIIATAAIAVALTGSLVAYYFVRKRKNAQDNLNGSDVERYTRKPRKHVVDVFHNAKNHLQEPLASFDGA